MVKTTKAYKIMEYHDGIFKTLFHGNFGSRVIQSNKWIKAQIRERVKDGTSKTYYKSGWHVLPTLNECREYLIQFTRRLDKLVIVECKISGDIWEKKHSHANVLLAEYIYIGKIV